MNNADSDRRSEERSRLPMAVRCSVESSGSIEVSLVEVSQTGCQLLETGGLLRRNCRIVLRPPAMHGLPGVVMWAADDAAGIKFDHPLHEAILKHLLYEPADSSEAWDFLDGFGRRLPKPHEPRGSAERRRSPGRRF